MADEGVEGPRGKSGLAWHERTRADQVLVVVNMVLIAAFGVVLFVGVPQPVTWTCCGVVIASLLVELGLSLRQLRRLGRR